MTSYGKAACRRPFRFWRRLFSFSQRRGWRTEASSEQGGSDERRIGDRWFGLHRQLCILQRLAAGHQVRTTVRNLDREANVRAMLKQVSAEPGDRLSFFAAELTQDARWREAVAGSEYVLHVASRIQSMCRRAPTK